MLHQIKTTDDGSHTLFVPELNEHYHSVNGAIQESHHIFINAGLEYYLNNSYKNNLQPVQTINILEIGFGTGLNALLTLIESEMRSINVFYNSLELYPVTIENAKQLNYPTLLSKNHLQQKENITDLFLRLHNSEWEKHIDITPKFTLLKQQIDFSNPVQFNSSKLFNIVYFDAFAPEKQPEMWTIDVFNKIFSLCDTGAVFTTYCAKGVVRRILQNEGFRMERLPGPPGKREILRGLKCQ
ncbi:MAG: tRNA (5-methylaminomethyl-2-thiouridine)(34)-methyltransferase MnmD [Fermentimonas sp.]|nr:tRNA (5-methylaminomethyl-2-thiouridine)(34)-methyltransferase MnmD [Fermentimonas sp.]